MGNRDHGPFVFFKKVFQPLDTIGVKVVGRFVEQQQIGAFQQEFAQGHSSTLTTGQRTDVSVSRREIHDLHCNFNFVIQFPSVRCFDLILDTRHFVVDFLHGVIVKRLRTLHAQLVVAIQQSSTRRDRFLQIAPNIKFSVELWLLRQIADRKPVRQSCFTIKFAVQTSHDSKQRTLA